MTSTSQPSAGADQLGVEINIVYAGEGVDDVTERRAELPQRQRVAVGVDPGLVQAVPVNQMVAHLVGGVGQQQHDLLTASRKALEQQGEAVAAEDGEGDADGFAAGLRAHVRGDLVDARVVALRAGHDGLGHGDDVAVAGGDSRLFPGLHDGVGRNLGDIVSLADNGRAHAARDGSDASHCGLLLLPDGIDFLRLIITRRQA